MIYTIVGWVAFIVLVVLVGLLMLPYLLWRKWVKGIPLTGKEKCPDFDLVKPEHAE